MKQFFEKYKHGWILGYVFIYMVWFFALENRSDTVFHTIHIKLDDLIPFNEYFVIPYFLWFAYIAVTVLYFFFTSKEDFYKCCGFLFIGMTICLIIYTFCPNEQNLRPDSFTRDNIFVTLVNGLYATDTSTNVCPSIHVYNSIGAHIAIINSKLKEKRILCFASFVLAVSICLSTVFLKQHSAFDGICAAGLSIVMYLIVYKVDYKTLLQNIKERKDDDTEIA